jgi:hypothetical protein
MEEVSKTQYYMKLDAGNVRTFLKVNIFVCGPGSAVGIGTRYGLDGLAIESRRGRYFPHPFKPTLGPTQLPVQWVPGLSWG